MMGGGCRGVQSVLDPKGPNAQAIAELGWIMFAAAAGLLALVMLLALYAVYRDPARRRPVSGDAMIFAGGLLLPVLTLSALLLHTVLTGEALRGERRPALSVEVVGHQFWWEVRYPGLDGAQGFATANELRIPSGVPVRVSVTSTDVIHSFWVPNLAGKIDAIPGRRNTILLHADRPGRFRGQCAEFCGLRHAHMVLQVIASEREAFARWHAAASAADARPDGPVDR
jgi:cytochrome c oxidase subunit 2